MGIMDNMALVGCFCISLIILLKILKRGFSKIEIAWFCFRGPSQLQFWRIKVPKPRCSYFGDYWKCHRPPKTIILDFGSLIFCRIILKYLKKSQTICTKYYAWKAHNLENRICWKRRVSEIPWTVLSDLENLEYGINIFPRTWNWNLGISKFK